MTVIEMASTTERILTLEEAAALLRVSAAALAEKAAVGDIPAQQIGGEWRFLQRALVEWLYAGKSTNGLLRAEAGSKEAVLSVVGIFKDDSDLDEQLAKLRAEREANR